MRTGLLVVTHDGVGEVLLRTAVRVLGMCPLQASTIDVPFDVNPASAIEQAAAAAQRLDQGAGVLVLTDMYGSTPGNVAAALLEAADNVAVVAGVNLPMLVRVLNYPDLDLQQLLDKAVSGGREGVLLFHRSC